MILLVPSFIVTPDEGELMLQQCRLLALASELVVRPKHIAVDAPAGLHFC
jgi:hypothetical protein